MNWISTYYLTDIALSVAAVAEAKPVKLEASVEAVVRDAAIRSLLSASITRSMDARVSDKSTAGICE